MYAVEADTVVRSVLSKQLQWSDKVQRDGPPQLLSVSVAAARGLFFPFCHNTVKLLYLVKSSSL